MTRYSGTGKSTAYAHDIYLERIVGDPNTASDLEIRPIFYLTNEVELTGEGTLTTPFRIF